MSEENKINEEFEELDKGFIQLVKNAENAKELSKEEIEKLLKEAKSSLDFLKLVDNIKIPEDKYVVYTDGDNQLVYENGEFFIVATIDSKSEKKKVKRKEAIDLYLEYFIKYQINPIIEKRKQVLEKKEKEIQEKLRNRTPRTKTKELDKEDIIKNKTKKVIEHEEPSL